MINAIALGITALALVINGGLLYYNWTRMIRERRVIQHQTRSFELLNIMLIDLCFDAWRLRGHPRLPRALDIMYNTHEDSDDTPPTSRRRRHLI
jgi:hypothetical protein